jgi:hypothetical protein
MPGRPILLLAIVASFALLLAACETTSDDDVVDAVDDAVAEAVDDDADIATTDDEDAESTDDEVGNGYPTDMDEVAELLASEGFALCSDQEAVEAADTIVPELDLASLEAQTQDRTFVAETYANTYVGEVTDDLLIGISLDSRYADQADGVSVYLCDSEDVSIYLWGDIEDSSATLSDDDVAVELTVSGDDITGTVTLAGEEQQSFTASEATDGAGMYVASDSAGEVDLEVRWVVAPDGRQRGRVVCCWPTSHITFACGCCLQQR